MAHSSTATPATTAGEINYFFQDENGKILKVLKRADIKQEPIDTSASIYTTISANNHNNNYNSNGNMGAFSQLNSSNQTQFVRIQNNYNITDADISDTPYSINTPHGSGSDMPVTNIAKGSERYGKYTQNNNLKHKSKLNSTQSNHNSVSEQRKRKPDKAGKGLRHFSMKVCEKVKEKGTTTYNEVADELVAEEIKNNSFDSNCDQKNIRRRVYDALNVLMAIHIISKDKKEIRWIGLPRNSAEQCSELEKKNEEGRERIKQKHQQLRELMLQQVAFKSLIERNKEAERQGIVPTPNSSIQLPFIIVNTYKSTKINCSVTNDKSEYIFKFDDKFEMHDDAEVLKRMGLLFGLDKGQCSNEDIERAKTLVPQNFAKYIEAYGNGKGVPMCDSDDDEIPTYTELTNDSQGYSHTTDGVKSPDLDDEDTFLENSDID